MPFHISKQARACCIFFLASAAALVFVLVVIYYPRSVDAVSTAATTAGDYRAFYEDAYASAPTDKKIESSYRNSRVPPPPNTQTVEIQEFVQRYHLQHKRVLEVGSGGGNLQDIVPDYTGLDISDTAKRFYHKRFVVASATSMPFPDNSFDAIWTLYVLEHVPKPEEALSEMRRVLRNGGLLYLAPAWQCRSWHAQGYDVRPYSDFPITGKLVKASIPLRESAIFRSLYTLPIRFLRLTAWKLSGHQTAFRYNAITPNYTHYWEPDSDAVNSMDSYEAILWFESRGDACLNYNGSPLRQFFARTHAIIIKIRK